MVLWLAALMAVMAGGVLSLLWFIPKWMSRSEADDETPWHRVVDSEDADTSDAQDSNKENGENVEDASAGSSGTAGHNDEAMAETMEGTLAVQEESPDDAADIEDDVSVAHAGAGDPAEDALLEPETPATITDVETSTDTDTAKSGDWFAEDAATAPLTFDASTNGLVFVWDDSRGPEPSIAVTQSDDDPDVTHVWMDDVIVGRVRAKKTLRAKQVIPVPLSKATELGWINP